MRTLANRRFRLLLLAVAGLPLVGANLYQTLGEAILDPGYRASDFLVYLHAARALRAGTDPYASYLTASVPDATLNQGYIYPPLLAWALQPLTGLDDHAATVAATAFLHLCLIAFVLLVVRVLRVGWEPGLWLYVAASAWFPTRQNLVGAQINLVLLLLSGIWLLGPRRWWGGAALGLATAVKFLHAPLLLYLGGRRRWQAVVGALAAVAAGWAVAVPERLGEYWTRIFPGVGAGTGFRENLAPAASLERLADPSTLYGQLHPASGAARAAALLLAVAVVAITAWRLGARPPADGDSERLEAAAVVAAGPLLATIAWPSHLVLLLLPLSVLAVEGVRKADRTLIAMLAAGYLVLGPVRTTELYLIGLGHDSPWLIRPLAETGVAGIALIYAAALRGLRHRASSSATREGDPAGLHEVTALR